MIVTKAAIDRSRYSHYINQLKPYLERSRRNNYAPAIFSFFAISLFGWYAVRPTLQTILYLKREIKDLSVVNEQMEQKISALIEAQSSIQAVEYAIPAVYEALPDDPKIVNLTAKIQDFAYQSMASISALQTGISPVYDDSQVLSASSIEKFEAKPLTYSITATGTYPSLHQFISKILGFRRLITINSLSIIPLKSSRSMSTDKILQLSLAIQTFYSTTQNP